MTTAELEQYLAELQADRSRLVRQLLAVDTQSASMSANGGGKSYTNRSVADIKAKIAFADTEIARVSAALGLTQSPDEMHPLYAEYSR